MDRRLTLCLGPGSFIEVLKILPLLVNPDDSNAPAFHVVAISVLGFGPSEGHHKAGCFSLHEYAEVSIMQRNIGRV